MFKTASGLLSRKQALVGPANLRRSIDTLADKGAKRTTARTLKVHKLGCLDVGALEHAVYAITIITLERRQVPGKRGG